MLYVFYGTDDEKVRRKTHELADGLLKKRPDASLFWLDEETATPEALTELVRSRGLFALKYIVILDHVRRNKDTAALLLDHLADMAASEHIFVLTEESLDAKLKKIVEKHATQTQVYDRNEHKEKERFNNFALADAFGMRSRKELWVLLMKAFRAGVSAEELHGVLFWQAKSMVLATEAASAEEAGLKPFVYSKSKRFAQKYSPAELRANLMTLVELYHDARWGKHELPVALEQWVLGL